MADPIFAGEENARALQQVEERDRLIVRLEDEMTAMHAHTVSVEINRVSLQKAVRAALKHHTQGLVPICPWSLVNHPLSLYCEGGTCCLETLYASTYLFRVPGGSSALIVLRRAARAAQRHHTQGLVPFRHCCFIRSDCSSKRDACCLETYARTHACPSCIDFPLSLCTA